MRSSFLRARVLCAALLVLAAACGDGTGGTGTQPNPVPGVTTLNPAGVMQGSGAFTLTVNGSNFVQGAIVRWRGLPRPTTFVSATRLTAEIAAADVQGAGAVEVSVFNPAPGGGASNVVSLDVSQTPPAVLTNVSPDTIMVDVGGTITVTGTGFVAGSRVGFAPGVSQAATFVSPTQMQFTLQPGQVPFGAVLQIAILTPDLVASNPLPLTVANPAPTVSSVSPAQAVVEQDSLVVHVTGTGFVRGTAAYVNSSQRTARRISPTQVDVVLTAADLATPGTRAIALVNLSPGGGGASAPVQVVNPAPTLTAVSPAQAPAAQDSLVVRLAGTGFVAATEVRLDGERRPARRISPTEMQVVLPAADLDTPGTLAFTVFTPQPGGGASSAASLTLTPPAPVLTGLPSNGATAGGGGYTLTVHGTGFVRTSRIRWNGVERTTRYVSGTRLEMDVAAGDVATPRTASVTVHTPGGGTSGAETITVRTPGAAAVTGLHSLDLPAGDIAYDAARGRIYATLGSGAGGQANRVVAINPATGAITATVNLAGDPGALALSDDGSALWVALDGTREVVRLSLPDLAAGTRFSTGAQQVEEMRVMPGRPGTVAVSLRNPNSSPRHAGVAVWDDGVRRARTTPGHTGPNSIVFGESADVLYGYAIEGSPTYMYTLRVAADGPVVARETRDVVSAGRGTVAVAGGRMYNISGYVADAGLHEFITYIPEAWNQEAVVVAPELGRVFYMDRPVHGHTLRVFDANTFDALGSAPVYAGTESSHGFSTRSTLIRWGTNGLALSDGTHIHIFRTALAAP